MMLVWIGFAVLVVAATAAFLLRKRPEAAPAVARASERRAVASPASATLPASAPPSPVAMPAAMPGMQRLAATPPTSKPASSAAAAPLPAAEPLPPPELAAFRLVRSDELPDVKQQAYTLAFANIPRPPKLLHHLLSPGFVNTASSAQLVDLITAEPLIAAKVLTAVNSPAYGLKSPVGSIGQAVTYLGLNTVRTLCLQYILIASFDADGPERRALIESTWSASALASELAQQLAQRLEFEDRGTLVSGVVLSFLGRLATVASAPQRDLSLIGSGAFLARCVAEQHALGLASPQIGRLLMGDWGLPASIADDAAAIDSMLTTPAGSVTRGDVERNGRLAVGYLAARIGERLADGRITDLETFDLDTTEDVDLYHLRGHLAQPKLRRLAATLRSPEVAAAMRQMIEASAQR